MWATVEFDLISQAFIDWISKIDVKSKPHSGDEGLGGRVRFL
jgi:hypothetical protein